MLEETLLGLEGDVELKERLGERADIARTAIAFANGRGGRIIIGVSDQPRRIVGVDPDAVHELERTLANIIHDRCEPAIRPVMTLERSGTAILLVVTVHPGSEKPYHVKGESASAATFIRIGSTNRQADQATVLQLTREAWHVPFDETPVGGARLEDLDRDRVAAFLDERLRRRGLAGGAPDDVALQKLGVAKLVPGGGVVPTTAGILFFGRGPQSFFPHARIRCARFVATDGRAFLDQAEIGGALPDQITGAAAFVARNTRARGRLDGLRREDRPDYPPEVIREAIANAVAHRDYAIAGADVRLAIYDDLIEVTSPGMLPTGITLSRLGGGTSEARNPTLATLLRDAGYAEQWGLGVRRMIDGMRAWGLPSPRFEEIDRSFRVTLPGPTPGADGLNTRQETRLDPHTFTTSWGDRRQQFWWVNHLEHWYGQNERQRIELHVVVCEESWTTRDQHGTEHSHHARFAWVSGSPLSAANVVDRCNRAARHRWDIEEHILSEKHHGVGLWHLVRTRGFHGTVLFLRETYLSPWLDTDRLRALRSRPAQLRLIL